jgi:hypothetical protein
VPERLLTMRESRERARFGRTRWYEILATNVVPVIRFNSRTYRIREADLDHWIAAGCPMPVEQSQK